MKYFVRRPDGRVEISGQPYGVYSVGIACEDYEVSLAIRDRGAEQMIELGGNDVLSITQHGSNVSYVTSRQGRPIEMQPPRDSEEICTRVASVLKSLAYSVKDATFTRKVADREHLSKVLRELSVELEGAMHMQESGD